MVFPDGFSGEKMRVRCYWEFSFDLEIGNTEFRISLEFTLLKNFTKACEYEKSFQFLNLSQDFYHLIY